MALRGSPCHWAIAAETGGSSLRTYGDGDTGQKPLELLSPGFNVYKLEAVYSVKHLVQKILTDDCLISSFLASVMRIVQRNG